MEARFGSVVSFVTAAFLVSTVLSGVLLMVRVAVTFGSDSMFWMQVLVEFSSRARFMMYASLP